MDSNTEAIELLQEILKRIKDLEHKVANVQKEVKAMLRRV